MVVTEVKQIPNSVCNRKKAHKDLQRINIYLTESDHANSLHTIRQTILIKESTPSQIESYNPLKHHNKPQLQGIYPPEISPVLPYSSSCSQGNTAKEGLTPPTTPSQSSMSSSSFETSLKYRHGAQQCTWTIILYRPPLHNIEEWGYGLIHWDRKNRPPPGVSGGSHEYPGGIPANPRRHQQHPNPHCVTHQQVTLDQRGKYHGRYMRRYQQIYTVHQLQQIQHERDTWTLKAPWPWSLLRWTLTPYAW